VSVLGFVTVVEVGVELEAGTVTVIEVKDRVRMAEQGEGDQKVVEQEGA